MIMSVPATEPPAPPRPPRPVPRPPAAGSGGAPGRAFRTISTREPFENAKDATLSQLVTAPVARYRSSSLAGPAGWGVPSDDGLGAPRPSSSFARFGSATKYAIHFESS